MSARARPAAGVRTALLLALALGSTGCARVFASYDVAPNGLARRDDALRRLLASGAADSARSRLTPAGGSAPEDELLRSLYDGILAHYAGAYDASHTALERAADLSEDRYTTRLSRSALSLLSNDKVLPYEPSWSERVLIHYYGALNFLRQNDLDGAAVEARRLGALLERDRDGSARDTALLGMLRYFSGSVFEAAGERNDAEVAYRNAEALLGGARFAKAARPDTLGEVIVLVEQGWVAHRVEQAVVLPLYPFEVDRLTGGEGASRLAAGGLVAARVLTEAAARSGSGSVRSGARPRTLYVNPLPRDVVLRECGDSTAAKGSTNAGAGSDEEPKKKPLPVSPEGKFEPGLGGRAPIAPSPLGHPTPANSAKPAPNREEPKRRACADDSNLYLLKLAWPVYRQESTPSSAVRVVAGDAEDRGAEPLQLRADLSAAVMNDFAPERNALLARTIARSAAKLALTRGVEKGAGKENEGLGQALGLLVNLGTALLEQADTRSWHLLPAQLALVRLALPPGTHPLTLDLPASAGEPARTVDLGQVEIKAGRLTFLSTRLWR
jgi:hypothetical protein